MAANVAAAQQPKRPAPKPPAKPAAPAPKPAAPVAKPAPPPDLVVKAQYSSNDKTTLTTLSSKGERQRIDYGSEMSVVAQCDTGKLLQIADQGQRFLTTALDAPPLTDANAKPPKKGGMIVVARTVTLTGERKEAFGQPAKRAKIVVTRTPSADACDKHSERVETDGWFIEPPVVATCTVPPRKPSFAITNGCRDDITYADADATAGYPISYTAVTTASGAETDNKPITLTMEVTS